MLDLHNLLLKAVSHYGEIKESPIILPDYLYNMLLRNLESNLLSIKSVPTLPTNFTDKTYSGLGYNFYNKTVPIIGMSEYEQRINGQGKEIPEDE